MGGGCECTLRCCAQVIAIVQIVMGLLFMIVRIVQLMFLNGNLTLDNADLAQNAVDLGKSGMTIVIIVEGVRLGVGVLLLLATLPQRVSSHKKQCLLFVLIWLLVIGLIICFSIYTMIRSYKGELGPGLISIICFIIVIFYALELKK